MFSNLARLLGRRRPDGQPAVNAPVPTHDEAFEPAHDEAPGPAHDEASEPSTDAPEQAEGAPAEAAPDPVARVNELSRQGKWDELAACGRAVLTEARADEILAVLAYSLQQQGRLQEAAHLAFTAAEIAPDRWLAQFIAGVAFKGLDRPGDACKHLRRALEVAPTDAQTLRQFAELIAATEGLTEASAQCRAHSERAGLTADVIVAPIRGVREWAAENGAPVLEAGEVETIPFKPPVIWGEPSGPPTATASSNRPYVAELSDVRIFSNSGIILTADGTALSDVGADPRFGSIVKFTYEEVVLAQEPGRLLLQIGSFETSEIDGGIWLAGLASSAFGHWMPEFLPKLQFLEKHPAFAELPLIVDADMPQSHFDHLRRLATNPLLPLERGTSILCRRLLVASAPSFLPVDTIPHTIPASEMPGLSMRALRYVRANDGPRGHGPGQRRIFLARRNMHWRQLLNEPEIRAALAARGFESVYLEEMTASEQIALFRDAGWIVAPNGSALLNVIFADPGVKLLILSQPEFFNWGTYQGPFESLGYQPHWVCGDRPPGPIAKHSDYEIPLTRILSALHEMGMPEAAPERPREDGRA